MRIMAAASMLMLSFVLMRMLAMACTTSKISELIDVHARKMPTPRSMFMLPDSITSEKSRAFSRGISNPTSVLTSMVKRSITRSEGAICSTM